MLKPTWKLSNLINWLYFQVETKETHYLSVCTIDVYVCTFHANKISINQSSTLCGFVPPYGDIDLGQHWRHQTITCINVDLSSTVFRDIYPRTVSQDVRMNLIRDMCWEFTLLKSSPHLPVASDVWCHAYCSPLVPVIGAKPSPEPMLTYHNVLTEQNKTKLPWWIP